ncbi:cytoplasmic protein [Tremella mesenterica]|uniref:GPN-loop GTPase 2 n=1 Tax=Tremella mesenterica TaxID=5217 RepID=A0A4Q1BGL9_TREME|nr:cytoplasmic protein [Tremella mesenterica]
MKKGKGAFGQIVTGPPGAGKTTYCYGMYQFLTALGRPVHIINLDPAVPNPPYPCKLNISELITLDQAMDEHGLGPNGAMLYCIEYLEENFDWLEEKLNELIGQDGDGYVIFDTPGQVELWTNHESLKRIIGRLGQMEYKLAAVHLSDAHYITDASKFISAVLLAMRAMLQLELPHINVLSKIDLLAGYGPLPFDLKYFTEVQDLSYLLGTLNKDPRSARYRRLNKALVELIDDYQLVGFEPLAVEDKTTMMKLLRLLDKATGYVFIPSDTEVPDPNGMLSTAAGPMPAYLGDVDDVQERWVDRKEEYDEAEREEWAMEAEIRARKEEAEFGQDRRTRRAM